MRLEDAPDGPADSEHGSLAAFLGNSLAEEPALDAMVLASLGRLAVSAPPLLPEQVPRVLVPFMREISCLQCETNHCLRVVCMKVALGLSLVFNADMCVRAAIASAMATFVAGSEEVDQEALHGLLQAEFDRHNVCCPPVTSFLAQSDFLRAFGYTEVFRSTVAKYASDLGLCILREPGLSEDELIAKVFPSRDECVGREVLPRLSAVGLGLAQIVAASLSDLREEYEGILLA